MCDFAKKKQSFIYFLQKQKQIERAKLGTKSLKDMQNIKKIGEMLKKEIIKDNVKGSDLIDIKQFHLKEWGINVFSHRVALEKHIINLCTNNR